MTKQEKVQFAIDKLQELYPSAPIPLDHRDPYTLLIAVLLSAQSTDVKVNQITPLLFSRADSPQAMVMAQAFNVPAFPVDTHIHRLMYRWNFSNGKNVVQTEKDAKRLFPRALWNTLHLQIIWYGREYSPARGWDLEKDVITRTIGRKSVLEEYHKKRPGASGSRKKINKQIN